MTIREFIETIKETEIPVVELITTKKYISSAEKIRVAKEAIDFSVEYDRGFVKFDSYAKHLSFIFKVIEAHTDLHFADDWAERMQEYDALYENDLLNATIDTFRKDYEASLEVLEMICGDMLADNSIEASVAKVAQSISENLDVFVGTLSDKFEKVDIEKIIPKNLDLNKLQEFLKKIK